MTKQGSLQSLLQYCKQNKKKVALAIVCLVLAGTIGQRYLGKRAVTAPPIAARVQVVKAGPADGVLQGLNTTTALRAIADVALRTKVEAPIQEIFVHKNQFITKGQPLLELEHNNQSAKLQSAAAQINMNEAAAVAAQAEFANAAKEQERYDLLISKGYATRQEVAARRTTSATAGADYNKAVANIAYSEAEMAAAQATLSDYLLKAPFDGIVLDDYNLTVGSKLNKDTDAVRIADISKIKCTVNIPESKLTTVKPGMLANVVCDTYPGRKFQGTVQTVNSFIDTASHTFQVDVIIDNTALNYLLRPGLFAKVFLIEDAAQSQALAIPTEALRQDGTVLVAEDKKVIVKKVQTGIANDKTTAITDGLQEGDLVIVNGGNTLKEGDAISYDE